jgi:hypothetical protein
VIKMRMKKGRKKMKTREINLKLSVGGLRLNIIVIQDPMIIFYDNIIKWLRLKKMIKSLVDYIQCCSTLNI